jgi:hypothetical protein
VTDLACGLCNDLSVYPDGVTLRGCPVHHPTFWRVETISALYFLDFTHGVVVRERKTNPMHPDWPEPSHLRRDGESMELISVDLCQEGVGMEMYVQLRNDGVMTYRSTTPVVSVTPVQPFPLPHPEYVPG